MSIVPEVPCEGNDNNKCPLRSYQESPLQSSHSPNTCQVKNHISQQDFIFCLIFEHRVRWVAAGSIHNSLAKKSQWLASCIYSRTLKMVNPSLIFSQNNLWKKTNYYFTWSNKLSLSEVISKLPTKCFLYALKVPHHYGLIHASKDNDSLILSLSIPSGQMILPSRQRLTRFWNCSDKWNNPSTVSPGYWLPLPENRFSEPHNP